MGYFSPHNEQIKNYINPILDDLKNNNILFYFDNRDSLSPGFKFNEWEMKGVPLRIEVGMRDVSNNKIVVARRDNFEKNTFEKKNILSIIVENLLIIQDNLFKEALDFRNINMHTIQDYGKFKEIISDSGGFIKCGWDGNSKTENLIKQETNATIRCIIKEIDDPKIKCIYSKPKAKYEVIFSKAY